MSLVSVLIRHPYTCCSCKHYSNVSHDLCFFFHRNLVSLPSAPGLPSHKSSRPYTVYELEQVRQHCRRWDTSHCSFYCACPAGGITTQTCSTVFCRYHTAYLTWTLLFCTYKNFLYFRTVFEELTESIWTRLKNVSTLCVI